VLIDSHFLFWISVENLNKPRLQPRPKAIGSAPFSLFHRYNAAQLSQTFSQNKATVQSKTLFCGVWVCALLWTVLCNSREVPARVARYSKVFRNMLISGVRRWE